MNNVNASHNAADLPVFRVSMKAIIRDSQGRTLFVRESGSDWILPGGGVEPGEKPEEALARELREELGLSNFQISRVVGVDSFFADWRNAWVFWVICEVQVELPVVWHLGQGISDARFMHARDYGEAANVSYALARKWADAA